MAARRQTSESEPVRRSAPARTPRAREQQLAAKAYDLAEKQLDDGTASSQVMTHFLKAASYREELEQARIEHEIELMKAKKDHMAAMENQIELFGQALAAMTEYKGGNPEQAGVPALD